jgi:hypothetical protein
MKTKGLKVAGLTAMFLITASIAGGGDAGSVQQMRVTLTVPTQVTLLKTNTFRQTGLGEFSNDSCLTSNIRSGAYRITGAVMDAPNSQVSITTVKEGTVRIDNNDGAIVQSAADLQCTPSKLKITYPTADAASSNNNPILLKIIPA